MHLRIGAERRSLIPILVAALAVNAAARPTAAETARFAVIGDFGRAGAQVAEVSRLVKRLQPDFVLTVGDNNYPDGSAKSIDQNVGQYFHEFIAPYSGAYGAGADTNRFFPSLGNHDWQVNEGNAYFEYFDLPGNERYYDFVRGPIHFFALDSDPREPDGILSTSKQAQWLRKRLANCSSPWRVVYFHHPPYSSGKHGGSSEMQWPFAEWAASVVISGHDHDYERISKDGVTYLVNGLGGAERRAFTKPVQGSQVRFADDHGALWIEASDSEMTIKFLTTAGATVDSCVVRSRDVEASRDDANRPSAPARSKDSHG